MYNVFWGIFQHFIIINYIYKAMMICVVLCCGCVLGLHLMMCYFFCIHKALEMFEHACCPTIGKNLEHNNLHNMNRLLFCELNIDGRCMTTLASAMTTSHMIQLL